MLLSVVVWRDWSVNGRVCVLGGFAKALHATNGLANQSAEILDVKLPWQVKAFQYLSTFGPRYESNLEVCKSTCDKQSFQRN